MMFQMHGFLLETTSKRSNYGIHRAGVEVYLNQQSAVLDLELPAYRGLRLGVGRTPIEVDNAPRASFETRIIVDRDEPFSVFKSDQITLHAEAASRAAGGYRRLTVDLYDVLLGEVQVERRQSTNHEGVLELPEGQYPLKITLYLAVLSRPRWPTTRHVWAGEWSTGAGGIPMPEPVDRIYNSTFGGMAERPTLAQILMKVQGDILHERAREGWAYGAPPPPRRSGSARKKNSR